VRILSLTTAEQGAGLALFEDNTLISHTYWASPKTHSRRLMNMVEAMVESQAGINISDIDGFIAAKGPGSFTGLRIGIGVVQGLAFGVSKPAAGVSSLDGIGFRFSSSSMPVCVMMDAKRNEVYSALYEFRAGALSAKTQELVCSPETVLSSLRGPCFFVGSGALAYQDLIKESMGNDALFAQPGMDNVCAVALARPALENPAFFSQEHNRLVPTYLRKSDAEIQYSKK
jgi:tRNA threonylcarbamoyladenosine biosynthesis protein TsaB